MGVASVHMQDRYNVNLESSPQNHHVGLHKRDLAQRDRMSCPRLPPNAELGLKLSVAPGIREVVSN